MTDLLRAGRTWVKASLNPMPRSRIRPMIHPSAISPGRSGHWGKMSSWATFDKANEPELNKPTIGKRKPTCSRRAHHRMLERLLHSNSISIIISSYRQTWCSRISLLSSRLCHQPYRRETANRCIRTSWP